MATLQHQSERRTLRCRSERRLRRHRESSRLDKISNHCACRDELRARQHDEICCIDLPFERGWRIGLRKPSDLAIDQRQTHIFGVKLDRWPTGKGNREPSCCKCPLLRVGIRDEVGKCIAVSVRQLRLR